MALPTLSALKSQKTSAAVTCVFGQNQEFEIPEACSKQCLIMISFTLLTSPSCIYAIIDFNYNKGSIGGVVLVRVPTAEVGPKVY